MKVYFFLSLFLLISCKKENTDSKNKENRDFVNQKTALVIDQNKTTKNPFSYENLIGKTFFEVSKVNNEYYYVYQYFTFDMNHRVFMFDKTKIKHLDPVEWVDYNVLKTETLSDKIKVKISYPSGVQRDLYFKYSKSDNTLRFSENPDFLESIVLFDKSKKDLVKYKSIKQPKISFDSNVSITKASGSWFIDCENLREYYATLSIDPEQKGAFFMPFDQEDFFIPCAYKLTENSLVLKLHPDASKTKFVDWNKYSKDSIIGHFGFNNENRGKLYWYGIYNKEKKKRDYHTIIFNQEKNEEGIESPIVLEKCD
ncbi:hypothetical protein [Tenacibaculum maritimum]|uniref:hypothetical protein n=1 Tax=Tenacibaculum maritimum TaxID=107401 RepID=UPI003876D195